MNKTTQKKNIGKGKKKRDEHQADQRGVGKNEKIQGRNVEQGAEKKACCDRKNLTRKKIKEKGFKNLEKENTTFYALPAKATAAVKRRGETSRKKKRYGIVSQFFTKHVRSQSLPKTVGLIAKKCVGEGETKSSRGPRTWSWFGQRRARTEQPEKKKVQKPYDPERLRGGNGKGPPQTGKGGKQRNWLKRKACLVCRLKAREETEPKGPSRKTRTRKRPAEKEGRLAPSSKTAGTTDTRQRGGRAVK